MAWSPQRHRAAPPKPYVRPPKTKSWNSVYSTKDWRITKEIVLERDGHRCRDPLCKTPHNGFGGRLEVDHIVELSDGGHPFDPENCLTRCQSCHKLKTELVKKMRKR
jgi:5-methylcytosine-specific restriction endonuclease McrA